jgi:ankyrin repeat protein
VEIVRHLLSLNATADVRDSENHTPLHLACGVDNAQPGHLEIVSLLLEKGSDASPTISFLLMCRSAH